MSQALTGLGKTSDGLAFLTNNRDVTLIMRCYRRVVQKETQTDFYLLILLAGILLKSEFGYWDSLICSYESKYILLVDFDLFNRHNQ